jgi:hypothetical protein
MMIEHSCMLKQACNLFAIAALLLPAAAGRWFWHRSDSKVSAQTARFSEQGDGQHDFDFYVGKWRLHNRRLVHPLSGAKQWVEFEGTSVARKMWDGRANMDEFEADSPMGRIEGMTVRLYNADTHEWSIYWANGKAGAFSKAPIVGRFRNARGEFYEHEELDGRPVFVRFVWQVQSPTRCHWEQAFSTDAGKTWETNWTIDSTRLEGPAL